MSATMQNRPNKWKKSIDQIKNAKIKWTQFSTDKRSVIQQFRILSFEELQEKYSNLSDFFWRDNGKCLCTLFICLKKCASKVNRQSHLLFLSEFLETIFILRSTVEID